MVADGWTQSIPSEAALMANPQMLTTFAVSPDTIGIWRLRKALALDDARWAMQHGRATVATQRLRAARFAHREIMRIQRYLRSRGRIKAFPFASGRGGVNP